MEINVAAVFGVRLLDSFGLPCVGLLGGWMEGLLVRFAVCVFRERLSVCVCASFGF